MKLINTLTTIVALGSILSMVGCFERSLRAGGTRSVRAGKTQNMAVYGVGANRRLEFMIISDIPSNGTLASAGSTWEGRIVPKQGLNLDYNVVDNGVMIISGIEMPLAAGRVFLVSTKDDKVTVTQITPTKMDMSYDTEIDRIIATEEVQKFLDPEWAEQGEERVVTP